MMRESASVRLTWSFGPGPATGGSGGRPPGLRPVFSASSARASNSARSRSRRSRARASITALASAMRARRSSRRASSSGTDIPSGTSAPSAASANAINSATSDRASSSQACFHEARCAGSRWRHLGAVQRHRAELQHPGFPGQQQHLDEQPFAVEKTPPERGDGIVVGMIVGRDEAESDES